MSGDAKKSDEWHHAKVFQMLRALGFRETESQRALEHVRTQTQVDRGDPEQVLRAALSVLTPSVRAA
jgi:Holliday junction resolvasome RuvABC DNA-binding subunit